MQVQAAPGLAQIADARTMAPTVIDGVVTGGVRTIVEANAQAA